MMSENDLTLYEALARKRHLNVVFVSDKVGSVMVKDRVASA